MTKTPSFFFLHDLQLAAIWYFKKSEFLFVTKVPLKTKGAIYTRGSFTYGTEPPYTVPSPLPPLHTYNSLPPISPASVTASPAAGRLAAAPLAEALGPPPTRGLDLFLL